MFLVFSIILHEELDYLDEGGNNASLGHGIGKILALCPKGFVTIHAQFLFTQSNLVNLFVLWRTSSCSVDDFFTPCEKTKEKDHLFMGHSNLGP